MKAFYGCIPENESVRAPKAALGTFDGVHRGHQRVLRNLLAWARATDSDAMVVTFDRKPRNVLGRRPPEQITSLKHRALLFDRLGMDVALVLEFNETLASCEPEDFVHNVLVKQLRISGVLLGPDTRFGHKARGDIDLLRRLGSSLGFEARSVPVQEIDGVPVSSTRVRQAIQSGNLRLAERMLGRRVSLLGTVVRGTARGKEIGYPTANLDLHHEVRPPEGVYATQTLLGDDVHDSVTNIGRPPSLDAGGGSFKSDTVAVETHILDFSGDLYGEDMEVRFVEHLRSQRVFESAEALAAAIASDVRTGRTVLAAVRGSAGEGAG